MQVTDGTCHGPGRVGAGGGALAILAEQVTVAPGRGGLVAGDGAAGEGAPADVGIGRSHSHSWTDRDQRHHIGDEEYGVASCALMHALRRWAFRSGSTTSGPSGAGAENTASKTT